MQAVALLDKQDTDSLPWLTIETALYGLLALLALLSRFYALDARPLTSPEAAQALHAWQSVSGPGGDALAASPLLFAGQSLAFALLGAGDAVARLLPALAGAALVLLPYLLRHRLGRIGALAASALLLVSPTALLASRTGSGDVLLLAAGLTALTGLIGWMDFRRPAYLYLTAVSAALALTAAPGACTLIVALAVAIALLRILGAEGWLGLQAAWQERRNLSGEFRLALVLFIGVLALVPTTLLLHPEGVQAVAELFPAWINGFAPWAGEQHLSYPLAVLILYEPLLLLFGLAGAIRAFRERDLLGRLLAVWAGVALLIALLAGGRGPGDVLLIVGPLAVLAGGVIGRVVEEIAEQGRWEREGLIVGLLLAIGVFFYIELASYAYRRETNFGWLALLSLALSIGIFALYALWYGWKEAWRGGAATVLLLLSLSTVSAAANLAYRHAHDPRELLVIEGTSPNARDLPAVLEQASMQRLGAVEIIPITVDESAGPVVRWYLRDFKYQTWLPAAPGPETATEAVITPWKPYLPDLGAAYFGQDFAVRTTWQPRNFAWADWADWLLFRDSSEQPQQERVVLWLRDQGD